MKKKLTYEEQIKIFETLGYTFNEGVTKEMILDEVLEMEWECEGKEEAEQHIEDNPFSLLYSLFGWRSPEIEAYNYSEHSISFDLEFFDHILWYEWFMERMGTITNGEINFTDIKTFTDDENYEWIEFKVNGIEKKWKLAKKGYIADTYVQRFSYLPKELQTKGRYTYYSDGGQLWVTSFATEEEQQKFNEATGLKREWLGEGNHFDDHID